MKRVRAVDIPQEDATLPSPYPNTPQLQLPPQLVPLAQTTTTPPDDGPSTSTTSHASSMAHTKECNYGNGWMSYREDANERRSFIDIIN